MTSDNFNASECILYIMECWFSMNTDIWKMFSNKWIQWWNTKCFPTEKKNSPGKWWWRNITFSIVRFSYDVVRSPIAVHPYTFEFVCLSIEFSILSLLPSIETPLLEWKLHILNSTQKRIYYECLYSFIQEAFIKYAHFGRYGKFKRNYSDVLNHYGSYKKFKKKLKQRKL